MQCDAASQVLLLKCRLTFPRRYLTKFTLIKRARISIVRRLTRNKRGATAIEYGLIAALIAVAAIGPLHGIGNRLSMTFANIAANLNAS